MIIFVLAIAAYVYVIILDIRKKIKDAEFDNLIAIAEDFNKKYQAQKTHNLSLDNAQKKIDLSAADIEIKRLLTRSIEEGFEDSLETFSKKTDLILENLSKFVLEKIDEEKLEEWSNKNLDAQYIHNNENTDKVKLYLLRDLAIRAYENYKENYNELRMTEKTPEQHIINIDKLLGNYSSVEKKLGALLQVWEEHAEESTQARKHIDNFFENYLNKEKNNLDPENLSQYYDSIESTMNNLDRIILLSYIANGDIVLFYESLKDETYKTIRDNII